MRRRRILVLVSGLAATGKSTLCKKLAKELGVKLYSGGDALMQVAKEMGYNVKGVKWWDTEEGLKFLSQRQQDKSIDRRVDEQLINIAKSEEAVIDSWVLPWLIEDGFKVWLKADMDARARRMSKRGGMSLEEATQIIQERDRENYKLYLDLYGIKIGDDLSPFQLVLDSSYLSKASVFKIVYTTVKEYFKL